MYGNLKMIALIHISYFVDTGDTMIFYLNYRNDTIYKEKLDRENMNILQKTIDNNYI